jgi:hypothetical protein
MELCYLVASADGLAPEERDALAQQLEAATGGAVNREALQRHFADLDASSPALGRGERLARAASAFQEIGEREEALGFAALIAVTDGVLAMEETTVLLELGEHFDMAGYEVHAVIKQVLTRLTDALRAASSDAR